MSEERFAALQRISQKVSRETLMLLESFEEEVKRWNSRINLVSKSNPGEIWDRHILDCVQIPFLKPDAVRWLDLGSGGGFPGLVIAVIVRDRPGAMAHLVESNRKKSTFLTSFAGKHGLPVKVHSCRIEDAMLGSFEPEIVTARALAPLSLLLELTERWLGNGSIGLFQKGREYRAEIEQSSDTWRYDLIEHVSESDHAGRILEISGLERR